jgi:hypothetical protein
MVADISDAYKCIELTDEGYEYRRVEDGRAEQ